MPAITLSQNTLQLLFTLAVEVAVVFSATQILIFLIREPKSRKVIQAWFRLIGNIIVILGTFFVGYFLSGMMFVLVQGVVAVGIAVLMWLYYSRLASVLGKDSPLGSAVTGGVLVLVGLMLLVPNLQGWNFQGVAGGLLIGGLGAAMLVTGIRRLSAGE